MTVTEMRKIARRARTYGHYRETGTRIYLYCPLCRTRVHIEHLAWEKPTAAKFDEEMLDHLKHDCTHC